MNEKQLSDTVFQSQDENKGVHEPVKAEQTSKNGKDQSISEPLRKRLKVSEIEANTTVASFDESLIPLVDVWSQPPLSLKKTTRIEVKWDLICDEQQSNQDVDFANKNSKVSRWWGANLLPHDGKSFHILHGDPEDEEEKANENVHYDAVNREKSNSPQKNTTSIKAPIRILDYDPYPDGGFLERDISSVIFLNQHSLMDINNLQSLWYRIEGSNWDEGMPDDEIETEKEAESLTDFNGQSVHNGEQAISLTGEDGLRNILDKVLETAMKKSGVQHKMMNMPAAQQCFMADRIVKAKERMLRKLMSTNTEKGVEEITPEHVRKCMEEIGAEGL